MKENDLKLDLEQTTLTPSQTTEGETSDSARTPCPAEVEGSGPPKGESPQSDGEKLLNDIKAVMKRFVVLPVMAAEALALWVVHTYVFSARTVTVYIGVVSPEKRCGKTTLLTLLGTLANRALVAANISPSALFRVIEETQPTLLIDEADTFLQGRDELRGILNAGYKRESAYVVRVGHNTVLSSEFGVHGYDETEWTPDPVPVRAREKGGSRVMRHSCWCPKVIAAIGRLPDTLADRCIVITMQRKTAAEPCERMRELNAASLRARCVAFARAHREAIGKTEPSLPGTLNDRAADIWEPLLGIADIAGGEWPELARRAALKLSSAEDEPTLLGYFLWDVRALFVYKKTDRLFSRDIVELLNQFHDRPWEDLRRGREINEWWLGQRFRELGMRSRTVWIGQVSAKGYLLEDFEEAFRRYLPKVERESKAADESADGVRKQIAALFEQLVAAVNKGGDAPAGGAPDPV